jgi:ADP-ribose pyrophosphatase YjhB (NUDIX family)
MPDINIRVGSAVMVEKDGCLLLGVRGKEPGYGNLIIPGGGVDLYEDFKETAAREIREEAGIEIKNLRQFKTYQLIERDKEHRVIIFWKADWASGELRPSSDLLSAKFYNREEIASEIVKGAIRTITLEVLKDAGWCEG